MNQLNKACIKQLDEIDYLECWAKMRDFNSQRNLDSMDEIWLLNHPAVFTLGLAGLEQHILKYDHNIPIIKSDRGGQVTYHGPGQIIIYIMLDIRRLGISIRELVTRLENGIIEYLAQFGIVANGDRDAPGVYVDGRKIASLGLKVSRGCTYHGISFNYDVDKIPFSYINPCGFSQLEVVNLSDLTSNLDSFEHCQAELANYLIKNIFCK